MLKKDFQIESNIYKDEAIRTAIIDFAGFDIAYIDSVLKISGESDEEVIGIFNEFMNYVLGLQNEKI